jgi:hypothetical protein
MKLVRTILAVFISAGLALAPVQAAYGMRMVPMTSMENAADATPLTDQECFCCDVNVRCPVNPVPREHVRYALRATGPGFRFHLRSGPNPLRAAWLRAILARRAQLAAPYSASSSLILHT